MHLRADLPPETGARELPLKAERGVDWKMKGPLKDSREEPLDLLI